jgi:hypothetical protein
VNKVADPHATRRLIRRGLKWAKPVFTWYARARPGSSKIPLERFVYFMTVIPAQAGIQTGVISVDVDPRLRGDDGNDAVNNHANRYI